MTVTKVVPSSPNAMVRNDFNFMGLSTDTKPQKAPVNALFLELDTGDFYYCAKQGSESIETLFDGTVEEDNAFAPTALPSGEMTVVYGGTSYNCQPKTLYIPQTGMTVTYYGATITLEELPQFDWSEYPFNITLDPDGDVEMTANFEDSGEHNISISAIVETPAEWNKVGEGSSPTPPTPTPTKYYAIETSETGHDVYMGVAHYTVLLGHDMKCDVTDTNGITVTIDMEVADSNVWEGSDELFEVGIIGIVQDVPAYEVGITPKTETFAVSFSFYSLEPLQEGHS